MNHELSSTTFPPGFLWGTAIGAHQSEGNNTASDWWYREHLPDSPIAERCGDAIDSYHRWPEDLDLAAGAGFKDYRFGIEWSRIEPADGAISHAALDHYRRIVEGAVTRGLRPTVTLHHFTLPLWFAARGGWLAEDAVQRFLGYVDALAPVLEAGVERVMTINEPNIVAVLPKLASSNGDTDLTQGLPVPDEALTKVMIAVHRATVERLRTRHPHLELGWGVSVQDYQADPGAEAAADAYCEPRDQVFLRASKGDDYVGVQTYTRGLISADGTPRLGPDPELTQTGWEFYPPALGGTVRRVARIVGDVPLIVTENGVATSDDTQRIRYTTGALRALRAAMDDGVDVRGYFHWSLLDNWEWGHWGPAFGLVAVDRETFTRTPKPSLTWLGSLAPEA
ncbi:glycoside hydrolase family 1 protein [Streptomyces sp. NBC_00564]|uniref:glycoside hydrolase family 1 protein n=1 Tax=Streptomyces sp. NBC_00564 TaxID=2903663 RepID=UPI00352D371C|nr:family 1 glycosylhydrolase [Streptomyces sp. NBC_00564]